MKAGKGKKPQGQIRRSQVLTTFGPGAMIDLPKHSVIVGGLDHWLKATERIDEPRLLKKVREVTRNPQTELYAPPVDPQDPTGPMAGITAWLFPEWFVTQETFEGKGGPRVRHLVPRKTLTRGKYVGADKKKHSVVPIRFVRACPKGHVSDIDWLAFVHRGEKCTHGGRLSLEERGTSGDLGETFVRCECGVPPRRLLDAQEKGMNALGNCNGHRPWLGPYTAEKCGIPSRLLIRSASNSYFPMLMRVISLPESDQDLKRKIADIWEEYLQGLEHIEELQFTRKKMAKVKTALEGYSDELVWSAIEARRVGEVFTSGKTVKQAEFEAITKDADWLGEDGHDSDFFAERLKTTWTDVRFANCIERVVLVHRLREVSAMIGFTRFDAITPDKDGELSSEIVRAEIATEASWRPAIENRGEGIFIQLKNSAINAWMVRSEVVDRERQLLAGYEVWKATHPNVKREFFGGPYYLLHTLSHLLLITVSLECGYSLGSLRERVFASDGGYGILIYTATPDAEGTLGGLVEAGRKIESLLQAALETGRLCSNDPVCSHHDPKTRHDERYLLGSACHGCLLIAETSCEQFNDFLDRALLVPTVDDPGSAFFK